MVRQTSPGCRLSAALGVPASHQHSRDGTVHNSISQEVIKDTAMTYPLDLRIATQGIRDGGHVIRYTLEVLLVNLKELVGPRLAAILLAVRLSVVFAGIDANLEPAVLVDIKYSASALHYARCKHRRPFWTTKLAQAYARDEQTHMGNRSGSGRVWHDETMCFFGSRGLVVWICLWMSLKDRTWVERTRSIYSPRVVLIARPRRVPPSTSRIFSSITYHNHCRPLLGETQLLRTDGHHKDKPPSPALAELGQLQKSMLRPRANPVPATWCMASCIKASVAGCIK